ncbi:MAG: PAS domain S-box protein [Myxococcota bacterium]
MSLRFRLNLIMSVLIVLSSFVTAKIILDDARHSIREEMEAGTRITHQLLASLLTDRSFLARNEEPSVTMYELLRGVRRVGVTGIRLFREDGTLVYASPVPEPVRAHSVPDWFASLVAPELATEAFAVPGGRVELVPDPTSALFEEWDDLHKLIRLLLGFLVLVNLVAFWLLGRALSPIAKILGGLSEMERGRLETRLPRFGSPEFDAIGQTFNQMAAALERGHAENARLALIAKQSSDAILIHDLDGRVSFWNPAAERLFGYRADEIVGRSADLLLPGPGDALDPERPAAPGTDAGGSEDCETQRRTREGRIVHVALSVAPLVDPTSGAVLGEICRVRDITARKLAEATERELVENRRFTQRMQTRLEEERRSIARELHDELGQYVTAIKTIGTAIANRTADDVPDVHRSAQAIVQAASHIYDGVHGIIRQLRPGTLDHFGLPAAIEELVKSWSNRNPEVECTLEMAGDVGALGEPVSIGVYRLVQESLTNVARHAGARRVRVEIRRLGQRLTVDVADDGRGLPSGEPDGRARLGVVGMRERVQALGGEFRLDSERGVGVRIHASIPVPTDLADATEGTSSDMGGWGGST